MFEPDAKKWAIKIFGEANLDDKRRNNRLVTIATDLAENPGESLPNACRDGASIEGAYRFIENDYIDPSAIAQAGFEQTAAECANHRLVLALEDTTGLSFNHNVCEELGNHSCGGRGSSAKGRSLYQHSILALDADTECVIGLAHQQNYIRNALSPEFKSSHSKACRRPREEKESYRWEESSKKMDETFIRTDNVIHICDREADSYEYMDQHLDNDRRFLIRCKHNRSLQIEGQSENVRLKSLVDAPAIVTKKVKVEQRGKGKKSVSRPGTTVEMAVSYHKVTFARAQDADVKTREKMTLNLVVCSELEPQNKDSRLCWFLYTNEPIESGEDALRMVRYYELRWRIEDFHKVWKTDGTNVESLRMQTRANMERIATIKAFVAIRLMQFKEIAENEEEAKEICCEQMLSPQEWTMLWMQTQKGKLPSAPPSLYWAYYALAKLGGWYNSKRTGRVGIKALWKGWEKLMLMIKGYRTMVACAHHT